MFRSPPVSYVAHPAYLGRFQDEYSIRYAYSWRLQDGPRIQSPPILYDVYTHGARRMGRGPNPRRCCITCGACLRGPMVP
jgi:hypothetical protein